MSDVLLLHAGVADSRMWEPQRAPLEATGHRVLAPDLRGFGTRQLEPGAFSHVDDVATLLGDPAVVVGNSLGGRVAIELALERPGLVGRLVLVAPGLPGWEWSEETRAGWREEAEALDRGDIDEAVEANVRLWVDGLYRLPSEVDPAVRALAAEMIRRSFELQLPYLDVADERELEPPAFARLEDVRCPTLVLVGELDVPDMRALAENVVTRIPGARLELIADAAHLPSLERPDEFNRLLLGFLAR